MIRKYAEIFCWKNVSSFCSAKATHIFSAKNIRILYIESAKTVNEMTLNELVKLTTLWTTGPRLPACYYAHAKNGLNLHVHVLIFCMLECTFSLYVAHIDMAAVGQWHSKESNLLWEQILSLQSTIFTLSIRTPQLLTIYVLKFEPVQFTTRCCV